MTNEELMMVDSFVCELLKLRTDKNTLIKDLETANKSCANAEERLFESAKECNDLREREANALNANEELKARCTELMAERDEARRKLREVVLVLQDMWEDYKCLKFKSKAGRDRARTMAAKIKAFAEDQKLTMVQDESGKWGVK